jgi:3-oxoacyl-[acyl-carrier protein] reductase
MASERRVVVVTGGGIGIGRATCEAFGRAGDHVVVTDVLQAEGQAVAQAIIDAGGSAEFQPLDVRSTATADALIADILARLGRIDVLVPNAGIAHRVPLAALTDEKWDETFDIDLKGMFRVVRPALASMRAKRSGSIVCLSSIMGVAYGWDEHVHYSSAKSGVVGLVRGLAVELARDGIRVNGVAPGYISGLPSSCRRPTRSAPRPTSWPRPTFRWAVLANPKRSPRSSFFWLLLQRPTSPVRYWQSMAAFSLPPMRLLRAATRATCNWQAKSPPGKWSAASGTSRSVLPTAIRSASRRMPIRRGS